MSHGAGTNMCQLSKHNGAVLLLRPLVLSTCCSTGARGGWRRWYGSNGDILMMCQLSSTSRLNTQPKHAARPLSRLLALSFPSSCSSDSRRSIAGILSSCRTAALLALALPGPAARDTCSAPTSTHHVAPSQCGVPKHATRAPLSLLSLCSRCSTVAEHKDKH